MQVAATALAALLVRLRRITSEGTRTGRGREGRGRSGSDNTVFPDHAWAL